MAGNTGRFIKRLEREMREAAAVEEYERAARLRDDIQALQRALEKQTVVLGDDTDCDVIALAEDPLEAAVQVFYVRGGRIRGQRGWVVDKVEEATPGELVEQFLLQMYGEATIPREILVPARPPDEAALIELLSEQRGSCVDLRVPQRGDKKSLMETVERNAKESLAQHKLRRASDLTTRSRALQEIADALDLDQAPLRIECYDVSHIQGENVVASMVVFEDGLARKSEYRRFSIRSTEGDVASIYEVICRRFKRYLEERAATGELDAETDDEAGRDVARPGAAVNGVAANGAARDGAGPPRRRAMKQGAARTRTTRASPTRASPTRTDTDRPGAVARRRRSTRRPAGPASSPTRPTSLWWTAAPRRRRRPSVLWTSSGSTTSPCAGWPSGWRRSGCPVTTSR